MNRFAIVILFAGFASVAGCSGSSATLSFQGVGDAAADALPDGTLTGSAGSSSGGTAGGSSSGTSPGSGSPGDDSGGGPSSGTSSGTGAGVDAAASGGGSGMAMSGSNAGSGGATDDASSPETGTGTPPGDAAGDDGNDGSLATGDDAGPDDGGQETGTVGRSLACGNVPCILPGHTCCLSVRQNQVTTMCNVGLTCPNQGPGQSTAALHCTSTADCPTTGVCCYSRQLGTADCRACFGNGLQLCDPSAATAQCPPGRQCRMPGFGDPSLPDGVGICG